jgi:hypothetical protein
MQELPSQSSHINLATKQTLYASATTMYSALVVDWETMGCNVAL